MKNGKVAAIALAAAVVSAGAALGGYWFRTQDEIKEQGANELLVHEIAKRTDELERGLQGNNDKITHAVVGIEVLKTEVKNLVEAQKATNDHIDDLIEVLKEHYSRPH